VSEWKPVTHEQIFAAMDKKSSRASELVEELESDITHTKQVGTHFEQKRKSFKYRWAEFNFDYDALRRDSYKAWKFVHLGVTRSGDPQDKVDVLLKEYNAKVQYKSRRPSVLRNPGQYIPKADTWLGVIDKNQISGNNLTEVHVHDTGLKTVKLYDLGLHRSMMSGKSIETLSSKKNKRSGNEDTNLIYGQPTREELIEKDAREGSESQSKDRISSSESSNNISSEMKTRKSKFCAEQTLKKPPKGGAPNPKQLTS
jgi:hypothetical protein